MLVTHSRHFGEAVACTRKSGRVRSISSAFAYGYQTFNQSNILDHRAAAGDDCPDSDYHGEERFVPIALRSRPLFARCQQVVGRTRADLASPIASMCCDSSSAVTASNARRVVS
jgi:hypothetical protein